MGRLFGIDGVRGIVNKEFICEFVFDLGRVGVYVFIEIK